MLGLIVTTIVFFLASWYFRRTLEEQGIPKGVTRGVLVFTLAAAVSWGAAALVSWGQGKTEGSQTTAKTSGDLSQIMKSASQPQP